ncbi:K-box region and MADS-box transcription factor family protein [Arabidopsis thaliana]|uniref:K-box region and MADS-box transcription factor family protein n=2 Tax=Arabidopsis thaliana TaxID=3702 RepID=A0A1P8B602_ARATH|nr:K-box region and MADS-box transcription factor family protein [Arabidopsis thaliana]ANM67020.1 K-box region and MADS-box transcription factor family protein [Arabidopsis thaliana]|eukprot:NP_001328876.1 K-box region and MADS-box transcription factor family protein [Arabidopsis thaliana]
MVCSRKLTSSLFFVMLKSHSSSSLAVVVSMSTLTTGFVLESLNCASGRFDPINFIFYYLSKCRFKRTIERYKKAISDNSNTGSVAEINAQYYQQESAKLRQQIISIQNSNRQLMGETIGSMSPKELRNLEGRLERSITRIRSKKNELLFSEIDYMQKREVDLHNDNQILRAKVKVHIIYQFL